MRLGDLSAKYESDGDAGAYANTAGDSGGASYGAYQFATGQGTPQAFVAWLQRQGHPYGDALGQSAPGTAEFTAAWRQIAKADPGGFLELQHVFTQIMYFDGPVLDLRRQGIDVSGRSWALKNVIWSAAVQHGPQNIVPLFQTAAQIAGYTHPDWASDAELIRAIYLVRGSDEWTCGSPALRPSLRARFNEECGDALAMLDSERGRS
jgi:hypothetical protein